MKRITESRIHNFREYLIHEEKSKATVEKYVRDVTAFAAWLGSAALNKMKVLEEMADKILTARIDENANAE